MDPSRMAAAPARLDATSLLGALIPLIQDLSHDLPDTERYRRLLQCSRAIFPSDATALLRLDGDTLVPLAIDGLTSDTLGRRFREAGRWP